MTPLPPEVPKTYESICGVCSRKIVYEGEYPTGRWVHIEPPDSECEDPNHKASPIGG